MLTIFSIPKPFVGHDAIAQRNAIQSWLSLDPACEVILVGNDAGVSDVAREFSVRHVADVACTASGTPLLNSAFDRVQRLARYELLCYVNADIIFLTNLPEALRRIRFRRFLAVGRRWNLDVQEPLDFGNGHWRMELADRVRTKGVLFSISGIDYFIFRKNTVGAIPQFAVGRPCWDNWFIFRARELGWPVIDATEAITVVHQNHGYGHVPKGRGQLWEGPEADRNRELMGDRRKLFRLNDATWLLKPRGLERALTREHLKRYVSTWPLLHPRGREFERRAWDTVPLPRFIATAMKKRGLYL